MRKGILLLLVMFGVLCSVNTAQAFSFNRIFGGEITEEKATEIQQAEAEGYTCPVLGTSITINPVKGPRTYLIPAGNIPKSKKPIDAGKLIMGFYAGKTTTVCTKPCEPVVCTKNITLNTIKIFSTS